MKLLFDQNLSSRLVQGLSDLFEDSAHVRDLALQAADDDVIWNFAAMNEFVIVSKDADFHQRSFLFGHPPKVIWIRLGNCSTSEIEDLLRLRHKEIVAFNSDPAAAFLTLG